MKEEYRNRITLMSFVLTVFVIWLHAGESLISTIPGQIAVPGFFLLSGFLFFYGVSETEDFSKPFVPLWLRAKLRRRVDTLLIPYLCWNFLYFLIYLAAGKAEITEIFDAVFHYSCNPVFWYLYQLILITAVTPLLYRVMKEKKAAACWLIVIFLLAVFYGPVHASLSIQFINEDAFFYYSVGAFIALHIYKKENREANEKANTEARTEAGTEVNTLAADEAGNKPEKPAAAAVTERRKFPSERRKVPAAAAALLAFELAGSVLPDLLYNVSIIGVRLSGVLLLWFLLEKVPVRTADPKAAAAGAGETGNCTVRKREVRVCPWMKITFFIYATHYMIIRLVWAGETALGLNGIAAVNIAVYLLMPAVCTAAAYGLFIIMKKFLPKLLRLLTGGRGMQEEGKTYKTKGTGQSR